MKMANMTVRVKVKIPLIDIIKLKLIGCKFRKQKHYKIDRYAVVLK